MGQHISKRELIQAQFGLFVAIALQILVWEINDELLVGPQYLLIPGEILLAILISLTVNMRTIRRRVFNHVLAISLLALMSIANVTSLILVLNQLVIIHAEVSGLELLASAIAIFITNIIVYALWYWEIDSPGLSRQRWSKNDQDFQFTQQDLRKDFPTWRAQFLDYLYLSTTNAINFAPADARPLTHGAKLLMGSQALISVFTLALLVARSVSILG